MLKSNLAINQEIAVAGQNRVKLRNDPVQSKSKCTIELAGTFPDVNLYTKILELERGERAFYIRQDRKQDSVSVCFHFFVLRFLLLKV